MFLLHKKSILCRISKRTCPLCFDFRKGTIMIGEMIKKYREIILYIVFGGLTTIVSIGSFAWCEMALGMDPLIANVVSWVLAVTFAYITNKIWVFQAKTKDMKDAFMQMMGFYGGRLLTLGIEELILLIFINGLGFPGILVKIAAQVIVLIANYIISKCFIFRKKKEEK